MAYSLEPKMGKLFKKFTKVKSPVTKFLWWLLVFTIISAIIAFVHWLGTYQHSPIGGLHGKIGFAMIAVVIGHTLKRKKFFRKHVRSRVNTTTKDTHTL